ncbi:MAG: hypothetical protein RIS47_1125 [Bacteroidota bacterium]|jgi:predicted transposase/invertase (TIGR01784 family)
MGKHIRFDWAMKRLLRQKANFEILEGFLSVLLKEDVTIKEILESESNAEQERAKYNRVDILVKNAADNMLLIEVQNEREHDYFHRMNFGQAKLITDHLYIGDAYANIKRVYSINIVYFDLGQGLDYVYKGTTEFKGVHQADTLELSLLQKNKYTAEAVSDIFTTYYILKVNMFDDQAKDSLDEWIYFLKNSEIPDSFSAKGLAQAKDRLRVDGLSEEEKEIYDVFIKDQRIRGNEIETAQDEGRQKATEELLPMIEKIQRQRDNACFEKEEERKQKEEERRLKEEVLREMEVVQREKEEVIRQNEAEKILKDEALAKEKATRDKLLEAASFMNQSGIPYERIAEIFGLSFDEFDAL